MERFKSLKEVASKVRYGPDDVPNKYGFTSKMMDIIYLVNDEKPIEELKETPNDYDKEYYRESKWEYDLINDGNSGKKRRLICFYNE